MSARVVLLCDRCDRLLAANYIAPLCATCQADTHDWARPLTASELEQAARHARSAKTVQRPPRRRR